MIKSNFRNNKNRSNILHIKAKKAKSRAFTIIEVIVAIFIVGILITIAVISYPNAINDIHIASLKSDLTNVSTQLTSYLNNNNFYPTAIDNCPNSDTAKICATPSSGNSFTYTYNNDTTPRTYRLIATDGNIAYKITDSTLPTSSDSLGDYGLMAYYPLDGNANDISGNGQNGTISGTLVTVPGIKGHAYSFDSTSDFITTPMLMGNSDFGKSDARYTVSMWVKLNGYSPAGSSVILGMAYYSGFGIYLLSDGSTYTRLCTYFRVSGGSYSTTQTTLSFGQWHHVVSVLDRTQAKIKFYLNGELVNERGSISSTAFSYFDRAIRINGVTQPGGSGPWRNMIGDIDEVRIYSRALSLGEINDIYSNI